MEVLKVGEESISKSGIWRLFVSCLHNTIVSVYRIAGGDLFSRNRVVECISEAFYRLLFRNLWYLS